MVYMIKCNRSRRYIQGHAPFHDLERVAEYSELLMKEIDVYRCMDCGSIHIPNVFDLEEGETKVLRAEFDIGPPLIKMDNVQKEIDLLFSEIVEDSIMESGFLKKANKQ